MKRIMVLMGLLLLTLSKGTNAQSSCADIQRFGIDRQMNARAHLILQACGLAQPPKAPRKTGLSSLASAIACSGSIENFSVLAWYST